MKCVWAIDVSQARHWYLGLRDERQKPVGDGELGPARIQEAHDVAPERHGERRQDERDEQPPERRLERAEDEGGDDG